MLSRLLSTRGHWAISEPVPIMPPARSRTQAVFNHNADHREKLVFRMRKGYHRIDKNRCVVFRVLRRSNVRHPLV